MIIAIGNKREQLQQQQQQQRPLSLPLNHSWLATATTIYRYKHRAGRLLLTARRTDG